MCKGEHGENGREHGENRGKKIRISAEKKKTLDASNAEVSSVSEDGAGGGTRTHTESPPADFESATSTNSITPAKLKKGILLGKNLRLIIHQELADCKSSKMPNVTAKLLA